MIEPPTGQVAMMWRTSSLVVVLLTALLCFFWVWEISCLLSASNTPSAAIKNVACCERGA